MQLNSRYYSVLVVSSSEKMNENLKSILQNSLFNPISFSLNISSAKRAVLEKTYDIVIINTPLHDDFGTRFAIDVCSNKSTVCLLLAKNEIYDEIHSKLLNHGVFTLPKPTNTAMIQQALRWLTAARERLRSFEKKAVTLEEKMEEIRLVNHAKWMLIENCGMTEADVHKFIEKQAMDKCVSKKQIAKSIIEEYDNK